MTTITAHYVDRSEGMVWRFDVSGLPEPGRSSYRGEKAGSAEWLLTTRCGLSAISARDVITLAESIAPRPVAI